jgi:hypothetical protein
MKILNPQLLHLLIGALATAAFTPAAVGAVGTLSGPFTHRNLQVFLIHGEAELEGRHYATLSEAMANGIVTVKETGNVSELMIRNRSKGTLVFLNAGDIVKGGRQDRTVRDDLILPAQSGEMALPSFCVENGRWTKRGAEDAAAFSGNNKILSSKDLKLAARYGNNQNDVWSGVAKQQNQLNSNLSALNGKSVDLRKSPSASSLQLTLENNELEQVRKQYLKVLEAIANGKTDVIGFAYAINGEINSAEVYNNKNLFRALWPKLLDSAITEAIAELKTGERYPEMQAAEWRRFFQTAVAGSVADRAVSKSTRVKVITTATTVLFETQDLTADGAWLHKSFINKGKNTVTVPLDGIPNPPVYNNR